MDQFKKQLNFWKTSSKRNLETAEVLLESKYYDSCLFFGHLAIEKLLKGLVLIKTKQTPPYIHNLEKLAKLAEIDITEEQTDHFRTITRFNIAGRYTDIKHNLYKIATKSYTEKHFKIIKDLFLWLEKQYQ